MTTAIELEKNRKLQSTGIFLNFEVVREVWDLHKLEDGTKVRSRVILSSILANTSLEQIERQIKEEKTPELQTSFNFQNLIAIESPAELRGEPGKPKYSDEELNSCIVAPHLDFETLHQAWNIYNLGFGHTLKLRTTPIDFSRTSKYDANGIPIYLFNFNVDAKIELSPDLQKIVEKNKAKQLQLPK